MRTPERLGFDLFDYGWYTVTFSEESDFNFQWGDIQMIRAADDAV
jgi:hypothetical protein